MSDESASQVLDAQMVASSRRLEADITKIFAQLENRLLPSTPVAEIYSNELAEDGETHVIQMKLADGRILWISICPGEAVSCSIHCTGECTGSTVCESCGSGVTNEGSST